LSTDVARSKENYEAISNQQTEMRKAQAEMTDTLNTLKEALGKVITADTVKSLIQEDSQATLVKLNALEKENSKVSDAIPIHVSAVNSKVNTGVVKFSNIISEHESGYDQSTGKLTAKRAGYYYISCAILNHSSSTYIKLVHNENIIARTHTSDSSHNRMLPLVAILKLEVRDVVYLDAYSGRIFSGGGYASFSAFMISPM